MESNYKKVGHMWSKEGVVNPHLRGMGTQLKKILDETDGTSMMETTSSVQGEESPTDPTTITEENPIAKKIYITNNYDSNNITDSNLVDRSNNKKKKFKK